MGWGGGSLHTVLQARKKYSKIQVTKFNLTLRLLMSYLDGVPILDVSRSHTTTQHSR